MKVHAIPGVYDVPCPRCGAAPTEACWNLRQADSPLMYPHAERATQLKDTRLDGEEDAGWR